MDSKIKLGALAAGLAGIVAVGAISGGGGKVPAPSHAAIGHAGPGVHQGGAGGHPGPGNGAPRAGNGGYCRRGLPRPDGLPCHSHGRPLADGGAGGPGRRVR